MTREQFETLLTPALKSVRSLVQKRIKDPADAEDVLQEVLLRAFARRDQLREHAYFKTWLWSIALNEIRQFFRRERGLASLEDLPYFEVRDPAMSPLAQVEQIEVSTFFGKCVARLRESERATIRLRDIEDRSVNEVAAALKRSVAATKTAHFRARKRLARIILTSNRRTGLVPTSRAA